MGNFLGTMEWDMNNIWMAVITGTIIWYFMSEHLAKKKFREQLLKKSIPQAPGSINDVYLKDNVDHLSIQQNSQNPIYKIAITGGPCAGKSTSMREIQKVFSEKGYRVFGVPELPTMVVLAGGMILMSKFNAQERLKFQSLLIRFQMYMEDYITKLAQMSKMKAIVLCDRGTMDPQAYITKEQFQYILDEEGWSKVVLRDRRYDRVIFLSSAANGAQQFYTLENNVARSQGLQQARALDRRTLDAWVGHPHLTIIPNAKGKSFQDKVDRVIEAVEKTVSIQVKNARQSKILIKKPVYPEGLHVEKGSRLDIFLKNDNEEYDEDKLTQWGQNQSFCYQRKFRFRKEKDNNGSEFNKQSRKSLTSTQFVMLCEHKDPNCKPVSYERSKFAWNNYYYTIDMLKVKGQDNYLLRYYSRGPNHMEMIPDWVEVLRDVTNDKEFKVKYIARQK